MKQMKLVFCVLLTLALAISLVGCSFGGAFKVDKDGNVIIKDKDGDGGELVIGKSKWDKSKMHGLDAPKAELESSLSTGDGVMYTFSEMKEKDAEKYIQTIKDKGFTYNSVVVGDFSYTGTNKDGETINFTYDKDSKSGTIIAGKGDPPSEEDKDKGAVIGGSEKKWDSSLMGGLPDPGVKIESFWTVDGGTTYSLGVISSYEDYVEKIKECGFTEDPSESSMDDFYMYTAVNSAGDRVTFSVSKDISSISFQKADE